jgi:16S rRNA (cytidine1402-2'-O)-methyltransferase
MGSGFAIAGQHHAAPKLAAGLYVVATPIGNLGDISLRALETLAGAGLILCEDTRLSGKLLGHYGISTKRRAFHEHNERQALDRVLAEIASGEAVALISDAGTPLISDPGFPLVREARARGIDVTVVPGASAPLAALAGSGLPTDAFIFAGFAPPKKTAREKFFESFAARRETLIFYESPHRLAASLADMAQVFGGEREAEVARELTKKFETRYRGTLGDLAAQFAGQEVKGEIVVLVGGANESVAGDWQGALAEAMGDRKLKSAVDEIAESFSIPRREVYRAALRLKGESGG